MSSDGDEPSHERGEGPVQAFAERAADGVLHDDDDGEHGPERGDPEALEERRDVVEHGHQRERQPHLEGVCHSPRVLPSDPPHFPREPGDTAPEPEDQRAEPLPETVSIGAVVAHSDLVINLHL